MKVYSKPLFIADDYSLLLTCYYYDHTFFRQTTLASIAIIKLFIIYD